MSLKSWLWCASSNFSNSYSSKTWLLKCLTFVHVLMAYTASSWKHGSTWCCFLHQSWKARSCPKAGEDGREQHLATWPISVTTSLLACRAGKKREEMKGAAPRGVPDQTERTLAFSTRHPAAHRPGTGSPVLLLPRQQRKVAPSQRMGGMGFAARKRWARPLPPQPSKPGS